MPLDLGVLEETLANARRALLAARGSHGHWEGELSSSALSTATAAFALHCFVEYGTRDDATAHRLGLTPAAVARYGRIVREGLGWLALHQNPDGGWGDTTASFSNISTTCLCWSAFVADENWAAGAYDVTLGGASRWLTKRAGSLMPDVLTRAVGDRYGADRTFSVPILTMMALAGRLGPGPEAWDLIPPLPFELAALPQRWFKWLKLPVVSYALPALIAIGQVRHARRPSRNPLARAARALTRGRTRRLLRRIQPDGGGFLEATPLTSFVVMSLCAAGAVEDPVVRSGVEFLVGSVRPDGSWPIDTNLATWVTTLSVNALAHNPDFGDVLPAADRARVRDWLLGQQYRTEHPYTLADPGGWAWTDLPGGVPDADDTPGALLALRHLATDPPDARTCDAAAAGVKWLLDLQNRDGGVPTFCRGWGKLPFDRSSPDLTAHAIRAWTAWLDFLPPRLRRRTARSVAKAVQYLIQVQHESGAWIPLWFGNQHDPTESNPTYGTAKVLAAADTIRRFGRIPDWPRFDTTSDCLHHGVRWLLSVQNPDGGWGGAAETVSTIEETALAVELLAGLPPSETNRGAVERGVAWLVEHTDGGRSFPPSPIGFYFAKLWYWEALYPLAWAVAAFESARRTLGRAEPEGDPTAVVAGTDGKPAGA